MTQEQRDELRKKAETAITGQVAQFGDAVWADILALLDDHAALVRAGNAFVAARCECKGTGRIVEASTVPREASYLTYPCPACAAWREAVKGEGT